MIFIPVLYAFFIFLALYCSLNSFTLEQASFPFLSFPFLSFPLYFCREREKEEIEGRYFGRYLYYCIVCTIQYRQYNTIYGYIHGYMRMLRTRMRTRMEVEMEIIKK